jgi:hypothetical protein
MIAAAALELRQVPKNLSCLVVFIKKEQKRALKRR